MNDVDKINPRKKFQSFNRVETNPRGQRVLVLTACSALGYKQVKGKAIPLTGRGGP
jgi:hypothetical protein